MLRLTRTLLFTLLCCASFTAFGTPGAQNILIDRFFDRDNRELNQILNLPESAWQSLPDHINRSVITDADYWEGARGAITWLRMSRCITRCRGSAKRR